MSISVRDYITWTLPGSPAKYSDLLDPEEQNEAITYMSINTGIWGLWAWKTELEKSKLVYSLGKFVTSPAAPAVILISSILANVAAEVVVFKEIEQIAKFESVPWYHKFLWVAGV